MKNYEIKLFIIRTNISIISMFLLNKLVKKKSN